MTLEYMRKPAVVQRVINSQINEIVGGGAREAVPEDMLPPRPARTSGSARPDDHHDDGTTTPRLHDTPPFGVGGAAPSSQEDTQPGRGQASPPRRPQPGTPPSRYPRPSHRARRPPSPRHPLRRGVRRQEERAAQPHLSASSGSDRGRIGGNLSPAGVEVLLLPQLRQEPEEDGDARKRGPGGHSRTSTMRPRGSWKQVIPKLKQAPGFVGAYFVALDDGHGDVHCGLRDRGAGEGGGAGRGQR